MDKCCYYISYGFEQSHVSSDFIISSDSSKVAVKDVNLRAMAGDDRS